MGESHTCSSWTLHSAGRKPAQCACMTLPAAAVMPFARFRMEHAVTGGAVVSLTPVCVLAADTSVGPSVATLLRLSCGLFAALSQVLKDRLPFDELALLQENRAFVLRWGAGQGRAQALPWGRPAARRGTPGSPNPCRALNLAEIELHAISYEEQQAAQDARVSSATPGTPAAIFRLI